MAKIVKFEYEALANFGKRKKVLRIGSKNEGNPQIESSLHCVY